MMQNTFGNNKIELAIKRIPIKICLNVSYVLITQQINFFFCPSESLVCNIRGNDLTYEASLAQSSLHISLVGPEKKAAIIFSGLDRVDMPKSRCQVIFQGIGEPTHIFI